MGAFAQEEDTLLETAQTQLDNAQKSLDTADAALEKADDEQLRKLIDQVTTAQRQVQDLARELDPPLKQISSQLAGLGDAQSGEASDLKKQREALKKEQSALDAEFKRANLLDSKARDLADRLEQKRAQLFSVQMSTRVASPLSPALWSQISQQWPDDRARLRALYDEAAQLLRSGTAANGVGSLVTGALIALLLAFPLRIFLRHLGRRYAASRAPGGRLRRSGLALWFLLIGTLSLGIAAWVLVETVRAIAQVPADLDQLLSAFVIISFVAAFIGSLSASLLMKHQPTWRLFPLDDATVDRLRLHCLATAAVSWFSGMAMKLNEVAHTSDAATTATDAIAALLYAGLILSALAGLSLSLRARAASAGQANVDSSEPPPVVSRGGGFIVLIRLLGHVAVIVSLLAALFGYINLSLFIARQIIWITLICSLLGLLVVFADDLLTWIFNPDGRFSRALSHASGAGSGRLVQLGLLLSAVVRVLLILLGIAALVTPYGANLSAVTGWAENVSHGIKIGNELTITPAAVVRALLVSVLGLVVVHVVQKWLLNTYLPKTELDAGARNSISTVARYLGWLIVVVWGLTALGLDLKRLALVLSALSVGIGFGLQAITQNFVSGLILLAERPVKIGDWVRIGDQEGDVRKISVRATEIQVGDRSTLIVPNSELITKSVRNMTLSNPMGRVQLQFSVPLETDVARVRDMLLALFAEHEKVLAEPAPSVFIDSLAGGHVNFNSFAYVSSPRDSYGVRSQLFFALLQRMATVGIALQSPQEIRFSRAGAAVAREAGDGAPASDD
ncbi:small-conductance mechanosensitive channel [Xanthomonas euvesicatoria]|uniref:Small-conductance mechanosensitive channel n=1 Tax=Xanthomonas euvesicatoria TaxID=456327 RepID=A0AAW3U9S0_XANEU|nr:small-conductance mechanosensitive channel [Xanthomonas euvesicatoria]MBB4872486.1 small-conductance mechanosensitive channel [Xanthomonas euvesicatoria]